MADKDKLTSALDYYADDTKTEQTSGQGASSPYNQNPYQGAFDVGQAEAGQAQDLYFESIFGDIPERYVVNAPGLFGEVAWNRDDQERAAAIQAYQYLVSIFGDELGPVISAAMEKNPEQRQMMYNVLKKIAQRDIEPYFNFSRGAMSGGAGTRADAFHVKAGSDDQFLQAIADPSTLDSMTAHERNAIIERARAANSALAGGKADIARQLYLITGQTLSRNYDVYLTPQERGQLDAILNWGKGGKKPEQLQDADTENASFGIEGVLDIENAGTENPRLRIDREWARARPVKAAAVMDFLRTQLPGITFTVGDRGFIGDFLDTWDKGVDYVAGTAGTGVGYIVHGWGELHDILEQDNLSKADRERAKEWAIKLDQQIADGVYGPDDIQEAIRMAHNAHDQAEVDHSYEWGDIWENSVHPQIAGFGFGEALTRSADMLPGDPGYTGVYMGGGLLGNLAFDPTNWVTAGLAGAYKGIKSVAGLQDMGKFATSLATFRNMGRVDKAVEGIGGLRKGLTTVEEVARNGRYAIIPDATGVQELIVANKLIPTPTTMTRGGQEVAAWLVPNATPEQALSIAKGAGVTDIISPNGLIDVTSRNTQGIKKIVGTADKADVSVSVYGKTINYVFDSRAVKGRPARIGHGYIRNKAFEVFVKNPDDWLMSPAVAEAVDILDTQRQAYKLTNKLDEFAGYIQRTFRTNEHVARMIADARNGDDMARIFHAALTGNIDAPVNFNKSINRMSELTQRLSRGYDIDNLIERAADNRIEMPVATRVANDPVDTLTPNEADELIRDLTGGAHATGMFADPVAVNRIPEQIRRYLLRLAATNEKGSLTDLLRYADSEWEWNIRRALTELRIKKPGRGTPVVLDPDAQRLIDIANTPLRDWVNRRNMDLTTTPEPAHSIIGNFGRELNENLTRAVANDMEAALNDGIHPRILADDGYTRIDNPAYTRVEEPEIEEVLAQSQDLGGNVYRYDSKNRLDEGRRTYFYYNPENGTVDAMMTGTHSTYRNGFGRSGGDVEEYFSGISLQGAPGTRVVSGMLERILQYEKPTYRTLLDIIDKGGEAVTRRGAIALHRLARQQAKKIMRRAIEEQGIIPVYSGHASIFDGLPVSDGSADVVSGYGWWSESPSYANEWSAGDMGVNGVLDDEHAPRVFKRWMHSENPFDASGSLRPRQVREIVENARRHGVPERNLGDTRITFSATLNGVPRYKSLTELAEVTENVPAQDVMATIFFSLNRLDGSTFRKILEDSGFDAFTRKSDILDRNRRVWVPFSSSQIYDDPLDLPLQNLEAQRLRAEKAELAASHDDDVAELAFLRNIASGRGFQDVPLRLLPERSWFQRKVSRFITEHPWTSGMKTVAENIGKVLDYPSLARQGTWARALGSREFAESEQAVRKINRWYGRLFRSHGAGGTINLGQYNIAGELSDVSVETIDTLRNLARSFGLKRSSIDEMIGQLTSAKGFNARYEWYTEHYWERIARESPYLGAMERAEVAQVWKNRGGFLDRNPGNVALEYGENRLAAAAPTHYTIKRDAQGNAIRVGRPVFTADMMREVQLPDIDTVLNYTSFQRRLLRDMKNAGGLKKLSADTLQAMLDGWTSVNRFWKTSVLIFKLPFALPLRIIGEEHLRMAAFDNASLVNHPVEWLKMFRGSDEFAQFADVDTVFLGLLHEQFRNDYKMLQLGRREVTWMDDDYARSFNQLLMRRAKSPEVKKFLWGRSDIEALDLMQSYEGRKQGAEDLLHMWDEAIDNDPTSGAMPSRLAAVASAQAELRDIVGRGAFSKNVEELMLHGSTTVDDVVYQVGTPETTALIKQQMADGNWDPGAKIIPAREVEWERLGGFSGQMQRWRDWMFQKFYTGYDQRWARAPLYRGIAAREYQRLVGLGWSRKRALEAAKAYGYRQTTDLLYHIGETSSGHHFARNLSPFMPAWQELTTTWLYRIPKAMGGLGVAGLPVGYARLLRKGDVWWSFLKESGIVERTWVMDDNPETGKLEAKPVWQISVPFTAGLMEMLTGHKGQSVKLPLSSFTGILPDPFEGWKGLIPSIGAPSGFLLAKFANNVDDETIDALADTMLQFGREVSVGPKFLDQLFYAFDVVPPWESGSSEFRRVMRGFAVDDGIRIAYAKYRGEMPKRDDFGQGQKGQDKYAEAHRAWVEKVVEAGEKWATGRYLSRAMGSFILPFSFDIEADYGQEMTKIWTLFNRLPDGGDSLKSPVLEAFAQTYPEAAWYMNGKTIDLTPQRDFSEADTFWQEINQHFREAMTPEEYLRFSIGMQSYRIYQSQRRRLYKSLGDNPAEVLMHGWERQEGLLVLDQEWDSFLRLSEVEDPPGGGRSFAELFKMWQDARNEVVAASDKIDATEEETRMLEAKRLLGYIANSFTVNGVRDEDFRAVNRKLAEQLSDVRYPESQGPISKGLSWWYDNIADPYYGKVNRVYDRIRLLEGKLRGPLYDELRRYADSQVRQTYGGVTYPTPEEAAWFNMPTAEQFKQGVEWSTTPLEWLTAFQRTRVHLDGDQKAISKFMDFVNSKEQEFDYRTQLLSSSSNDYKAVREAYDNAYGQYAKQLGVENVWDLMNQPLFIRLDRLSGSRFKNRSWDRAVAITAEAWNRLNAADISPRGNTPEAQAQQVYVVNEIEGMRKRDQSFDKLMKRLEVAMAPTGKEMLVGADLYWKLFFEGFTPSAPGYLVYGGV